MTLYRRPAALSTYAGYAAVRYATHDTDFLSLSCDPARIINFFVSPLIGLVRSPLTIANGIVDGLKSDAKFIKRQQAKWNAGKEQKKHTASERLAAHRKAMADGTKSPYFS